MFRYGCMDSYLKICGKFFLVAVGVALGILMFGKTEATIRTTVDMSYLEMVAAVLTALGVILAALAVFLGGVAYINWRRFDDHVRDKVEEYLEEFVKPTERYDAIKDLIEENKEKTQRLAKAEKELENLSNFDEDEI